MKFAVTKTDIWGASIGAFATVSQVILLRESLSVAGGNELSAAVGFVGWFLGVAAGAAISSSVSPLLTNSVSVAGASSVSVVFGFVVLRLHRLLLGLGIGEETGIMGLFALLMIGLALGGLAAGALFTIAAMRLSNKNSSPVSRLYAAESIGAVTAALVFYWLLAGKTSHSESLGIAASVLFCGAAFGSISKSIRYVAITLSIVFLFSLCVLPKADSYMDELSLRRLRNAQLVGSAESVYGRLTLVEESGQYEVLSNGRFEYAFPDPYDRPVSIHLALSAHRQPDEVLIIGGGFPDRLEAALAHNPKRVVITYIDEKMEELSRPHYSKETQQALIDPRVLLLRDDGRKYVSSTNGKYDVIIVSAQPPQSAGENRFHTQNFYQLLSSVLKKNGMVFVNAPGGANVLSKEAALSAATTYHTLRSVFSEILVIPGMETVMAAANEKKSLPSDHKQFEQIYTDRNVKTFSFSARRFFDLLDPVRTKERTAQLENIAAEINTDDMPRIYSSNLALWEKSRSNSFFKEPLTVVLSGNAIWFFGIPILILILWRIVPWFGHRSYKSGATVSVMFTGAVGMASQLAILLAFQANHGTLYTAIAMLTAVFMFGLAIGALIGKQYLSQGRLRDTLNADLTLILFVAVLGLVLKHASQWSLLCYVCSAAAGIITGSAFPAFLGMAAKSKNRDEREVAASIESADHLGAAFGAFVTGIVFLPVYGLVMSCLIFAALKSAATLACIEIENKK